MGKQNITESMKVHDDWYKRAKDLTLEDLPAFLKELMEDYGHDYGTICHALSAGAIGTLWAMNKHDQGGITGFQASCIMWDFISHWNYTSNKTGMKLVDFDKMLYPQYAETFAKTMPLHVWESLQREAQANIDKAHEDYEDYLKRLKRYKIDIAYFVRKYPDYYENQSKYDRIGYGTWEQFEEQSKKEAEGFEFAPSKPCSMDVIGNSVYRHWESIVAGIVPFGYKVEGLDNPQPYIAKKKFVRKARSRFRPCNNIEPYRRGKNRYK